jgi:SAM-dependent methyltransferase
VTTSLQRTRNDEVAEAREAMAARLARLEQIDPDMHARADVERALCDDHLRALVDLQQQVLDFATSAEGGRGDLYRRAQQDTLVRGTGILSLLGCAGVGGGDRLLDVLGGDGLVRRVVATALPAAARPRILTGDLSSDMVDITLAAGAPALLEAAEDLIVRDGSFDAVLVAYGAHHLPLTHRPAVCREAHRALRSGGRFVLHDFDQEGAVARWFREVVHEYSRAGHSYDHFTRTEALALLGEAGFADVAVDSMYDPFCVVTDHADPELALAGHLIDMYGLVRLQPADRERVVAGLADAIFRYETADLPAATADGRRPVERIQVSRADGGWRVEMPRVALVAVGTRP